MKAPSALTPADLRDLTAFRRQLHRKPELSGEEEETARTIAAALRVLNPDRLITGLGGHGVAVLFDSGQDGSTVMFRAELDGLPITERNDIDWVSQVAGKSHVCGHDGHMTMLLGFARLLSRRIVGKGRVVLLFQPAEETGRGAKAVIDDPQFDAIRPDWAFAIHLLPGVPAGHVATCAGLVNCASTGLRVRFSGTTAHAASPEDGVSPMPVLARLIPALSGLSQGSERDDAFRLVTLTHLRVGEPTFGVAPGEGDLYLTLRTAHDAALQALEQSVRALVLREAGQGGLRVSFEVEDAFAASVNNADAYDVAVRAMDSLGIVHSSEGVPMRASEDFGVFGWNARAAMLCLGPGENFPALHNPDYDFPDALIPVGAALFDAIARDILGA